MKYRTYFYYTLALLVLAAVVIVFRKAIFPCAHVCKGYEEKVVVRYVFTGDQDTEGQRITDTIRAPYECNEIILNLVRTNVEDTARLRDYLEEEGFIKVDSCACGQIIELWRYNGEGDADVIGVIKDPPDDVTSVGGLALNYNTLNDISPNGADINTAPLTNTNPDIDSPLVKVAIVDTGVDISAPYGTDPVQDPQAYLYPFLRKETNQPCGKLPKIPFGLNVLNLYVPSDLNGHGTHVNGIVAGYPFKSVSNEVIIDSLTGEKKKIRLELLNVRYTRGDSGSGSLFSAVCAIYYALDQGAEVINISWGFLDANIPTILEDAIDKKKDVIFVAGLGNGSLGFGGNIDGSNLRFWPAGFSESKENVISVGAANTGETNLANFSNRGNINIMNVVAPGEDIVSTFPKYLQWEQTGLAINSGTSMATPFVTRAVAMMIGKKKAMNETPTAPAMKNTLKVEANPNRMSGAVPRYRYQPGDAVDSPF